MSLTAPAYWDTTTAMIKLSGPAVYPVCTVHGTGTKAYEVCTAPAKDEAPSSSKAVTATPSP